MRRRVIAFVGLVGAALLAGAMPPEPVRAGETAVDDAAVAVARQSFVGEWKLNKELSDDPRAKMHEGRPEGRPEGGGPPGGGPGGGWGGEPPGGGPGGGGRGGGPPAGGPGGGGWGGGRRRGGGPGPERAGGPGGPAGGMLFEADRITITNLKPEITIVAPEGELRTLHADDKGYRNSSGGTVKTRWDGARLLVETKGERGGMKEAWTVSAEPRRLTVLLEVQRPFGGTVKIKRVFDPFQPGDGEPRATSPSAPQPEVPKP